MKGGTPDGGQFPRAAAASPPPEPSAAARSLQAGRPGLARSFRHHRPRGAFCGRGWCQQCPIAAGSGTALACEVPAGEGRPRRLDPLRFLGRLGERFPPWFYEDRFLRPRWLRQPALATLRRLSAAPTLPPDSPPSPSLWEEVSCGTLLVGAGPSGLAAGAEVARSDGDLWVVDAGPLGGTARWVAGLRPDALRAIEVLRARGGRFLERTLCLGVTPDGTAMIVGPTGGYTIRWERLILATGAYDRPLIYRGNDLPGTVGVRGFEALAAQGAFAGSSVVFLGTPDEAERARRVVGGARSVTVSEIPSGVEPDGGGRLLAAGGRRRVRWVEMDSAGRVPCDVLVLGFSQQTYELQAQAGSALRVEGSPPIVAAGPLAEAPVLVVGEAAGWCDPEAAASTAAEAARAFEEDDDPPTPPPAPDLASPSVAHPAAYVCWCEDVRVRDVERAVEEGFDHVELIKRRTGATTGPCQGKLCLGPLLETLRACGLGDALPTVRPPVRPVSLAWLGGGTDA